MGRVQEAESRATRRLPNVVSNESIYGLVELCPVGSGLGRADTGFGVAMSKVLNAIRPADDGTVDDVAITSDLFRLEVLQENLVWACAYRGEKRVSFYIRRKKGRLVVVVSEDTIGCEDDRSSWEKP